MSFQHLFDLCKIVFRADGGFSSGATGGGASSSSVVEVKPGRPDTFHEKLATTNTTNESVGGEFSEIAGRNHM